MLRTVAGAGRRAPRIPRSWNHAVDARGHVAGRGEPRVVGVEQPARVRVTRRGLRRAAAVEVARSQSRTHSLSSHSPMTLCR